ncbi:hypothetical protein [Roseovarius sp. MMSF_3350]|uniref:hypothetical protein n=1 Tax=Roseovarius sp. MMSF_3350 TaxID=3046706 RepID=UPI00273E4F9D|nr:hypothetical protein [Roseovarius sp. MMSF_3350]
MSSRPLYDLTDSDLMLLHVLKSKQAIEPEGIVALRFWERMTRLGLTQPCDSRPGDIERRRGAFVRLTAAGVYFLETH